MHNTATIQPATMQQEVCGLIDWTDEQLANYMYQQGLIFLQWYLPYTNAYRQKLESSKLFWNWWKQVWALHDEVFINNHQSIQHLCLYHRQLLYKELHSGRVIANDGTKPPQVVLNVIVTKPKLIIHA